MFTQIDTNIIGQTRSDFRGIGVFRVYVSVNISCSKFGHMFLRIETGVIDPSRSDSAGSDFWMRNLCIYAYKPFLCIKTYTAAVSNQIIENVPMYQNI